MNPDGHQTPAGDVTSVVENLFRHESARMVATLTRIFGIEHLELAEDVVQEALARAMQTWPFYGVPQNPAAWIMRASRNLALDVVRRQKVFREKQPEISQLMEHTATPPGNEVMAEADLRDDRLRLMFVCCHPLIVQEDQVALALKTLCGFSPSEIASAFLITEAAIAKRLTRAKQKIRDAGLRFELPEGAELDQRLEGVLQTLYLMFNEGYKASGGDRLIRTDVCEEAIRLTTLLTQHPSGNRPKTHALLALMLLGAARLPARLDDGGNLVRLAEQDRSLWDDAMIARGMFHIAQSMAGEEPSPYHIQSSIAACHCLAKDSASTDWQRILELYDLLVQHDDSCVVALNRAVAVAEVHGPGAGIDAIRSIPNRSQLESYHLLHAVLGDLEARNKNSAAAAAHFERAIELAELKSEREYLGRRRAECAIP